MVTIEWVQEQIDETLKQPAGRQSIIDLAALYVVRDHLSSSSLGSLEGVRAYLQQYAAADPDERKRQKDLQIWADIINGS